MLHVYKVSLKSVHWFRRKRFLKGFTIYGHGCHHGHFISIMSSNFLFLVPEKFLTKFGSELHSSF